MHKIGIKTRARGCEKPVVKFVGPNVCLVLTPSSIAWKYFLPVRLVRQSQRSTIEIK
jgi:hypothetical protein